MNLEEKKELIRNDFDEIKGKFAPHVQVIIEKLEALEVRVKELEKTAGNEE